MNSKALEDIDKYSTEVPESIKWCKRANILLNETGSKSLWKKQHQHARRLFSHFSALTNYLFEIYSFVWSCKFRDKNLFLAVFCRLQANFNWLIIIEVLFIHSEIQKSH